MEASETLERSGDKFSSVTRKGAKGVVQKSKPHRYITIKSSIDWIVERISLSACVYKCDKEMRSGHGHVRRAFCVETGT